MLPSYPLKASRRGFYVAQDCNESLTDGRECNMPHAENMMTIDSLSELAKRNPLMSVLIQKCCEKYGM